MFFPISDHHLLVNSVQIVETDNANHNNLKTFKVRK